MSTGVYRRRSVPRVRRLPVVMFGGKPTFPAGSDQHTSQSVSATPGIIHTFDPKTGGTVTRRIFMVS